MAPTARCRQHQDLVVKQLQHLERDEVMRAASATLWPNKDAAKPIMARVGTVHRPPTPTLPAVFSVIVGAICQTRYDELHSQRRRRTMVPMLSSVTSMRSAMIGGFSPLFKACDVESYGQ